MKLLCSSALLTVLIATSGIAQADFPKELVAKHPCLKEVKSPWNDPMPASKMPEALKDWDTVYVGNWQDLDGSYYCSAFLISSTSSSGDRIDISYTNAKPFYKDYGMKGSLSVVDGKKVLTTIEPDTRWWSIRFTMNEDGSLSSTSPMTTRTGLFHAYPVSSHTRVLVPQRVEMRWRNVVTAQGFFLYRRIRPRSMAEFAIHARLGS